MSTRSKKESVGYIKEPKRDLIRTNRCIYELPTCICCKCLYNIRLS